MILGDIYNKKDNGFNDVRFMLASLVLFSHSYDLLPGGSDPLTNFLGIGVGTVAVFSFFCLSGFFMIQSLEASSLLQYTLKRALRILPAFLCSLVLFSFIIIPFFSKINYLDAFNFVWKSFTFHVFGYEWLIKGAFPNNLFVDNINGSMWTLKHEVACYILLPVIYSLCNKNKKYLIFVLGILLFLFMLNRYSDWYLFEIPVGMAWVFSENEYSQIVVFLYYFISGVILYLFRNNIIIASRYVLLCFILIFIGLKGYSNIEIIFMLVLPYVIIVLPSILKINIFSKFGDYSYGMYIYAFPIQQLLIQENDMLDPIKLFLSSFFLTFFISVISWHIIENPIMKIKKYLKK